MSDKGLELLPDEQRPEQKLFLTRLFTLDDAVRDLDTSYEEQANQTLAEDNSLDAYFKPHYSPGPRGPYDDN